MESMSSKDRLLAIIAAEKASETALKASSQLASEAAAAYKEDKVSCASTETTTSVEQHGSLLRRGVATLRRSFRKAIPKKTGSFMNKKNSAAADFSHDSGLGEESDASRDPCLSPVTTPTPILRTTRSFSNDSQQPVNGKLHF